MDAVAFTWQKCRTVLTSPSEALSTNLYKSLRYRGNEELLPAKSDLQELWSNTYFIDALKNVTRQLEP